MGILFTVLDFWWQPGLLITFVLMLRKIANTQIKPRNRYKLWLIPLIRLILVYTGILLGIAIYRNYKQFSPVKWSRIPITGSNSNQVYLSDIVDEAMTFGFGQRASIYLPTRLLSKHSKEELQMIVAHEYGHIQQRDFIWNLVRITALILFWYNPLIWLAVYSSRQDAELAADAYALEVVGMKRREHYANILINAQHRHRSPSLLQMLAIEPAFSASFHDLKMRIESLYHKKERTVQGSIKYAATLFMSVPLTLAVLWLSFSYGQKDSYPFSPSRDSTADAEPSSSTVASMHDADVDG